MTKINDVRVIQSCNGMQIILHSSFGKFEVHTPKKNNTKKNEKLCERSSVQVALHQALPLRKLKRRGESLVHFDHVLDLVRRGSQFVFDFAYAPQPLTLTLADCWTEKLWTVQSTIRE